MLLDGFLTHTAVFVVFVRVYVRLHELATQATRREFACQQCLTKGACHSTFNGRSRMGFNVALVASGGAGGQQRSDET